MPTFQYHLPGLSAPLCPGDKNWNRPLPMDRHGASHPGTLESAETWTYGEYFTAARSFIEKDGYNTLIQAVSIRRNHPVDLQQIDAIRVTIMKHGAFYHPARIVVTGRFEPLSFVLNAAISEPGRQAMPEEVASLKRLYRKCADAFIPAVYGEANMKTGDGRCLHMFLGDWFIGYHEFHLSFDASDKSAKLRVWDEQQGGYFLTRAQARTVYHQAAYILTAHYRPESFEQIFPWHHAAGDFVVRVNNDDVGVRLITVRQYAPLFRDATAPADSHGAHRQIMTGILIFLLNLTIRMRVDRLDGTGELAWAGQEVLDPVWDGFIEGLAHPFFPSQAPTDRVSDFLSFLSGMDVADIFDLAQASAGGFHPEAPEKGLIEANLVDHVAALWVIITAGGIEK